MKNIIYLRCKRVGSSNFYANLKRMKDNNLINEWWGKSHMPATKCKEMCINEKSEKYWSDAVKVVSVRNPWIQQVSRFFLSTDHKIPRGDSIEPALYKKLISSFKDHMRKPQHSISADYYNRNWEIYTIDDEIIADVVMRLEDIQGSVKKLAKYLKCSYNDIAPCFKGYIEPANHSYVKRYDYRDFYDNETREIVYQARKKEINYFGYKF